ncbi:helix-turn-helix transcriptional regulator [Actinophytocola xanthii]|uniref:HTH luxR-type domain-containing protein n=1 Tax=Actinophytocola xanthii TaxID=1912961 RepID=A0A1Q8CMH5_9PSEU|nr:LuxR C-terminal-related transcriptional regulator [Actinophytocola xanthii]OLF15554.1 hypothetical protein BU204_21790 [Actinophytocola xanthii]
MVRAEVVALDPVLGTPVAEALRACPEVEPTSPEEPAQVAVVVVDRMGDGALGLVTATLGARHRPRVVLVAPELSPAEARRAVAAGVSGLLRTGEASAARLGGAVLAAAGGDCAMSAGMLEELVGWGVGLRPPVSSVREGADGSAGPRGSVLTERERAVLRLVAEGHETGEIARRLCYSTRTVTGVVHGITRRFRLRNRAHAVAFTLREGLL